MDETTTDLGQEELAAAMQLEYDETDAGTKDAGHLEPVYRYIRLRNRLTDELERLKAQTAVMLRQAQARIDSLDWVKRLETEQIVTAHLDGSKKRSVTTPWGTCGFRKQPERLVVDDEQYMIDQIHLGHLPDRILKVTTTERIGKTELADYWKGTGEIPDGCTLQTETQRFYVK